MQEATQVTPLEAERDLVYLDASPDIFEPAFIGFRNDPEGAIRKLLHEKRGEVPDAYHHPELGEISFVYGNERLGLAHIIAGHGLSFVEHIPRLLRTGRVVKDPHGFPRAYVVDDQKPTNVVVVRLDWNGREKAWVVTSFDDVRGKFTATEKTSDTLDSSASMGIPEANPQTSATTLTEPNMAVNDDATLKPKSMVFGVFPDQGIGPAAVDVAPNGLDATQDLTSAAIPNEPTGALDSVSIPIDQHIDVVRKLAIACSRLSQLTGEPQYALDSLRCARQLRWLAAR